MNTMKILGILAVAAFMIGCASNGSTMASSEAASCCAEGASCCGDSAACCSTDSAALAKDSAATCCGAEGAAKDAGCCDTTTLAKAECCKAGNTCCNMCKACEADESVSVS